MNVRSLIAQSAEMGNHSLELLSLLARTAGDIESVHCEGMKYQVLNQYEVLRFVNQYPVVLEAMGKK